MRINDLFNETESLEEGPVGTAVGAGLGALAGGPLGAAAGGVVGNWAGNKLAAGGKALKNMWQGAKQGYKAGQKGVAQPAPAQPAPAQQTQSPLDSIRAEVDKLDPQGKEAVIQMIQNSMQQSAQPAPAQPAAQPAAPAQANSTGPKTGQEVNLSGTTYRWLGAQWAAINPQTGKPGKVAEKGIVNALNKMASQGKQPGTPNLSVMQGGQQQQRAAESIKFESKFLGMLI